MLMGGNSSFLLLFIQGYASGSFGPTTAGRMDSYVDQLQANGGSKVMLAKGNRSKQVKH
jgi:fumarate hydratase class I